MKEKLMTLTLTQLRELAKAAGIRGTGLKKEALVDALVKADQERKEKAEKSEKPEKPEKLWHEMGEPADLNKEQLTILRESAYPASGCVTAKEENGTAKLKLTVGVNGLIHFSTAPKKITTDYGYDYEWYVNHA